MITLLVIVALVVGIVVAILGGAALAVDPETEIPLYVTPSAIVVEARVANEDLLMQVDTGYAGAPVISGPALARKAEGSSEA